MAVPVHTHPEDWIAHVFSAKAAQRGGVIRRSVTWVRNEIGEARFVEEVRLRGFHLLECGGQFVVVCSRAPIRRIV